MFKVIEATHHGLICLLVIIQRYHNTFDNDILIVFKSMPSSKKKKLAMKAGGLNLRKREGIAGRAENDNGTNRQEKHSFNEIKM